VIYLPPEQVIEQRLEDCGLDAKGIFVKYEGYLQSIEVVIKPEAGAASQHFPCIHKATGYEIVTFANTRMAQQYRDFTTELFRPKMLEDARKSLEKMGLLKNFPVRATFGSDKLFAEAIEVHCALDAGTAIKSYGESLVFEPSQESLKDFDAFQEKYSCLLTAMTFATAKRYVKSFGFVGNEAYAPEEEQK
jgi:hypothetical protein